MPDGAIFCYEQPLNERARTFLRIEHLTSRLRHHQNDCSAWGHRAAMDALLDILNVMARHDIRGQVHKELVQYRDSLVHAMEQSGINHDASRRLVADMNDIAEEMARIPPKFAAYQLRDNELLNSLNNRHAIPGGTCSFDLPSYQHWLTQEYEHIETDLAHWLEKIAPIERGVKIMLRLLRNSVIPSTETANGGVLVHKTEPGTQMIRVLLDNSRFFPEISGGRHRVTIRLMTRNQTRLKPEQANDSITFQMACCQFQMPQ